MASWGSAQQVLQHVSARPCPEHAQAKRSRSSFRRLHRILLKQRKLLQRAVPRETSPVAARGGFD